MKQLILEKENNMKQKIKLIGIIVVVLTISIFGVIKGKKYYDNKKEEERLAKDPYFTEYKLSRLESLYMMEGFYCKFQPKFYGYWSDLDKSKWPDYSYYTMTATEKTEKVVTVLNYNLFEEQVDFYKDGIKRAKEMGITSDNRLTVDWVMSHPKEAVDIMYSMPSQGIIYTQYDFVNGKYDLIISGEIGSQAE